MKIKKYKLFLETKQFFFPISDIQVIKDIFINSVGDYFEDLTYHERKNTFDVCLMDQWEVTLHRRELDEEGKNISSSKWVKHIKHPNYPLTDRIKAQKEHFNDYQELILNVLYHDDKIVEYLSHFYELLLDKGFLVEAWPPFRKSGSWRFHISTEESNPFIKSKNDLNKYNLPS